MGTHKREKIVSGSRRRKSQQAEKMNSEGRKNKFLEKCKSNSWVEGPLRNFLMSIQSFWASWEEALDLRLCPCFCHYTAKGNPGIVGVNGQSGRRTRGSSKVLTKVGRSPKVWNNAVLPSWWSRRWKGKCHWYLILRSCRSYVSGSNVFCIANIWRERSGRSMTGVSLKSIVSWVLAARMMASLIL